MKPFKNDFSIQFLILIIFATVCVNKVSCRCRYRNFHNLPRDIFSYWASWGCYIFTRSDLFANEPFQASICTVISNNESYNVTGIKLHDNCIPFYYLDPNVKIKVKQTFLNELTYQRWIECSIDALVCCDDVMMFEKTQSGYCPSVWDGWSCFDSIPAGETYEMVCPKYAYARDPPRCLHYSYKHCNKYGNWTLRTDYGSCDVTPKFLVRIQYQISMLTLSIIICTPAIIILIFDQHLHNQKLNMIRNFLIAIVVRDFMVILVKSTIITNEIMSVEDTLMDRNQWPCKLLSFFEVLAGNIVFTFMLLEGIYLHQLLTNAFRSRQSNGPSLRLFYISGGLIAFCSAIVWAIIMAIYNDLYCWQYSEKYFPHWFYDTPRFLMLITNVVLLIHIMVRLWNTLRNNENENRPNVRTVKVALVCSPLFGIPFFFTLIRPDTDSCGLEQFYYFTFYTIEALQGILIAILHCYRERDVKKKIKVLFNRFKSYVSENPYWKRRSSSLTDSETRRTTISSTESPTAEDIKNVPTKRILKINQNSQVQTEISDNETNSPLARYNLDSSEIMVKTGEESKSTIRKNSTDWSDDGDRMQKTKQVQFQ